MKTLLRSTFIAAPSDNADSIMENYRSLDAAGLGFEHPEDNSIWSFIQDFVNQHHHVPEVETIRSHFARTKVVPVVDRVVELSSIKPRSKGDFQRYLEEKAEDRRKKLVGTLLQEAGEIVEKGIEVKEERGIKRILRGPIHAIQHIMNKAHDIVTPISGARLSGDVTQDATDFLAEYQRVKNDPNSGVGQYTGIGQMDSALGGAKRNELWTHAAFTGHLKSTTMLNWAYTQATYYKHSSLIYSLEMPYIQCRRILYALHSSLDKFKKVHPPLDYQRIRDGQLSPTEEKFLTEVVAPDFNDPANEYGSIFIEVADPDKIEFTVVDVRARAELIHAKTPFRLLFIDHAGLLSSRGHYKSTTESLNEVIRDCKKMAMGFNRGLGMAVILMFQINREGYKAAKKVREATNTSNYVYNLTHLSYANETERSSDVVTASWVDEELQKRNEVLYQNLKARDHKPFEPFKSRVIWPCRRIVTMEGPTAEESRAAGEELDMGDIL